jgi:hypothetical protein
MYSSSTHIYGILFQTRGLPSFDQVQATRESTPEVVETLTVVYQLIAQRANYGRQYLTNLVYRTSKELSVIVWCARAQGCFLVIITLLIYLFNVAAILSSEWTVFQLIMTWHTHEPTIFVVYTSVTSAIMVICWMHVFAATASADFSLLMSDRWWRYYVLESKWTLATVFIGPVVQLLTLVCEICYAIG